MSQLPRRQIGSTRPARIVFLLEELKFGGTQRQTLELARRLDRRKFRSEIWIMRAGEDLAPLASSWQIPIVRLCGTSIVGPLSLVHLWRRLRTEKIDLFLLLTAIPNIWGRLIGKLAGIPRIIGNVRGNTAYRQHEQWLWPLTDHLICNNTPLERRLISDYNIPAERLTMIPNGVDTDFFKPTRPDSLADNLIILSIGRLVPDKDQGTLVEAFRLILRDFPDAKLWLVGDGPRKKLLEGLLRQNFKPHQATMFPGQVDIRPFLEKAGLFVLSSATEALPNVVLEAMAMGLPVVATKVGGLPDVVKQGQTGWLVPPRQPARLAEAMADLLADADRRRRFGRAGRQRAVERFSFQTLVRSYEALFDKLLAQPECG